MHFSLRHFPFFPFFPFFPPFKVDQEKIWWCWLQGFIQHPLQTHTIDLQSSVKTLKQETLSYENEL